VIIQSTSKHSVRERSGALPHDLGAPADAPWILPNSYVWQDISTWKDLNSKSVLMV